MANVEIAAMWIEGLDTFGRTCWCHTPSGFIAYSRPPRVGLFAVPHPPNVQQGVVFLPTQTPVAEQQWEEHTDEKTKKKYWHNKVTKKSTWDDPKLAAKKPPPPPPPPPSAKPAAEKPTPPAKKEPKVKIKEEDLWSKKKDGEGGMVWYNKNTKKSQRARPECMKKYRNPNRAK